MDPVWKFLVQIILDKWT